MWSGQNDNDHHRRHYFDSTKYVLKELNGNMKSQNSLLADRDIQGSSFNRHIYKPHFVGFYTESSVSSTTAPLHITTSHHQSFSHINQDVMD